jgi:DNA invertase Pin-like site-specific DNA recombinase
MLVGYARVAADEGQALARQRHRLLAAGCERIFEECASGLLWERPQLQAMLQLIGTGDVVVVRSLDRLSRSQPHLRTILDRIADVGAGIRALDQAVETLIFLE